MLSIFGAPGNVASRTSAAQWTVVDTAQEQFNSHLVLNRFVPLLNLLLQAVNIFLERLDHSLQFVVFRVLPLDLGFVVVDFFLKAGELENKIQR